MVLYWFELKKLLASAAVWGFLAACLLFNMIVVIVQGHDDYADVVGAVSKETGVVLDDAFHERLLRAASGGGLSAHQLERLQHETRGVTDVFDGYETRTIAERYVAAAGITGWFAEAMRDKYAALQKAVDAKAKRDESLTLYFAGSTHARHQFLFDTLTGWLITEGALVAVLLVLLSAGYETIHRTGHVVYATKTGREVLRPKLAAALTAGIGAYFVLAFATFLVHLGLSEYGSVWNSSVSSLFNYRIDFVAGLRPFVTWHSFSVLTYGLAMIGAGAALVLCFSLIAFGIGLFVRNGYLAFLVFLIANATAVVLPMQIPHAAEAVLAAKYAAMLLPVWLWLKHGIWFTDGDIDIIWPHFETVGLCVSLAAAAAFRLLAARHFRKRNLS
jgi:hypothetical protein